MPHNPAPRRPGLLCSLALAVALTACGGGVDTEPEENHADIRIDTAGRLAVADAAGPVLRIHDLDSGAVEASHTLAATPAALYPSPAGRYAVAMLRTHDRVQFIDAGIWQEDHGDHLHDYKRASQMMGWALSGPRPTHYDLQQGLQAAIFLDGNAAATPAQAAGVRLLTDASIASGQTTATLDLAAPLHGLAEPLRDKLLVSTRAADAPDTLPTHLELYQRSGSALSRVRQLPTRCNGMHGSGTSGSSTLVGCTAGMMLVRHLSATTVSDGQLLATPLRVGTVAAHPRLPDQFIGIATEGAAPAPVTTRFYAVDGQTAAVSVLVPQGWDTGRIRRAHGFDRSGQRFFILDDQGTLTTLQRQGGAWTTLARVSGVVPVMPSAAPWPALVANGARDELYISDPVARQLVVLNSLTGTVTARRNLDHTPGALAWLGITR